MMRVTLNSLALFIGLSVLSTFSPAQSPLPSKEQMNQNIEFIGSIFESNYAPAQWKRKFSQWDLDREIAQAKMSVSLMNNHSLRDYQRQLKSLLNSTKDYHVGIRFYSTESSTLPFQIKGADEEKNGVTRRRYFISFIDRNKLSSDAFPFQVGDEIVEFDGKPIETVVSELHKETGDNVAQTDRSIAELRLTSRSGSRGMHVPSGPVTMQFVKKGSQTKRGVQLVWDYTPESIKKAPEETETQSLPLLLSYQMMASSEFTENGTLSALNPHRIGGRKTFTPRLGKVIWESNPEDLFDAYIYLNEKNQLIGYIRIASYGAGEKHAKAFEKIISRFQKTTDGLVIDQVNNPGGSVFYLYALVSMLTDQPMATPRHQMSLVQSDVASAVEIEKLLKDVKSDQDAQKAFGTKTIGGYPVTYEFARFALNYCRFVIQEWEAGRTLTNPYHLYGVDHINPHPRVQYTHPILLLVNELDFSGGDFFPAILQDNQRVTIMGTRTAGAGGYVRKVSYPNPFGIVSFSYTGSLAKRVGSNPIENLGVTPDIPYSLSVKDLRSNYSEYKSKINSVVQYLIK